MSKNKKQSNIELLLKLKSNVSLKESDGVCKFHAAPDFRG